MSARAQTGWLDTVDGVRLYREDRRPEAPRAALLFVHGFGEHCGRYAEMSAVLAAAGYACFHYDYRGHGRSEGRRGHVFAFEDYLMDLRAARAHAEASAPGLPLVVLGHSNGGLIALHGVAREPDGLAGLVLSSPFFGFGLTVPRAKVIAAKALSRYVPALSLPTDLDAVLVSHDPAVVQSYAEDPLIGREASGRWFTESVKAHAAAPAAAAALRLPVLIQQAGDDRIASAEATRTVFERIGSPDRTYREYPGLYHEIWFELDRTPVEDLQAWLAAHLPAPPI